MITLALAARGATLEWPLLVDAPAHLTVHDPAEADWLHLLIGEAAYVDLVSGREFTPAWDAALHARLRRLAFGHWLRAWWPASVIDGVPPLDRELLDAEIAHLTDELDEVMALSPDEVPEPVDVEKRAPTQAEYALVAGQRRTLADTGVLSGRSALAWQGVPAGRVDATEQPVTWVLEVMDAPELSIAVQLLPGADATGLAVTVTAGGTTATGALDADGTAAVTLPLEPARAWALTAADLDVRIGVPVEETAGERASIRELVARRRAGTPDHNGDLYQAERALLVDDW